MNLQEDKHRIHLHKQPERCTDNPDKQLHQVTEIDLHKPLKEAMAGVLEEAMAVVEEEERLMKEQQGG